jgi:hypothetical protein
LQDGDQVPSLEDLKMHALKLFKTYSTTGAHAHARFVFEVVPSNPDMMFPLVTSAPSTSVDKSNGEQAEGDWVLANSILHI